MPKLADSIEKIRKAAAVVSQAPMATRITIAPKYAGLVQDTALIPTLEEVERAHILYVLTIKKGNKTHAAKALGISLKTMHNKVKKYKEEGTHEGSE